MGQVYVVTPLEKKSISRFFDMYETTKDGSIRGFTVEEHYRWGYGFLSLDDTLPSKEQAASQSEVVCRSDIGYGLDMSDGQGSWFNFDDSFTEEEKEEIENKWNEGDANGYYGIAWALDTDNGYNFEIEDDYITIVGPFKVDLADEKTCEIIQENIELPS